MKILAIPGSARSGSTNLALLRALAKATPNGMAVEVFTGLGNLPVFSPDREGAATPADVLAFARAVEMADALVIASPEYVHSIPGGLKNAIDWLVSRDELIAKPVALIHASHRGDGMLADLRRVLAIVTPNFLPDVFERFHLMKMSPEQVAETLARPDNQVRLSAFLAALASAVTLAARTAP